MSLHEFVHEFLHEFSSIVTEHEFQVSGMDKGPIPSPQVMLSLSKLIIIQFHTLMLTHPVSNDIVCAVRKALRQSVFYILNMANVIVFKTYLHPIPIL